MTTLPHPLPQFEEEPTEIIFEPPSEKAYGVPPKLSPRRAAEGEVIGHERVKLLDRDDKKFLAIFCGWVALAAAAGVVLGVLIVRWAW